jgi:hypothetical protein
LSLPYLQPYFGLSNSLQTAQAAAGGAGGSPAGGWVELGRTTLGTTGDTINVSSLANKRYLMILNHNIATGSNYITWNFGNGSIDTGSNYAWRRQNDGGSDTTSVNATVIEQGAAIFADAMFGVNYISNLSNKEKLMLSWQNYADTGAGTSPNRVEHAGKWVNTSVVIDQIRQRQPHTGDWLTGSEVVVLGWDPADTHTSNFWEELASVELGADGDNLSSGTISAKKYLWVQAAIMTSSAGTNVKHEITFNNDTGSNYAQRYSYNGGADGTLTSRANWQLSAGSNNKGIAFLNFFIINNAANEKLCIGHAALSHIAGAGTVPRREEAVAKWANTSNQITEIDIDQTLASIDYKTGSILKVWGAN